MAQLPHLQRAPAPLRRVLTSAVLSGFRQPPVVSSGTNRPTAATPTIRLLIWIFIATQDLWHETSAMPSCSKTSCADPTPRIWQAFDPNCACLQTILPSKTGRLRFRWIWVFLRWTRTCRKTRSRPSTYFVILAPRWRKLRLAGITGPSMPVWPTCPISSGHTWRLTLRNTLTK